MLMVQKFHSIHEIDPEFITNIEVLLQEETANFDTLVQRHDQAPPTDVFTYFLFFGPTQNSPVGFAQLCLRKIPSKNYLPWFKKLKFWDKSHTHWKEVIWQVGDGSHGLCIFDSRYARSGKEKIQELIKEYEQRPDVMAESVFSLKGMQEFKAGWDRPALSRELYVLEPFSKAYKTYQDYVANLNPEVQKQIKSSWRNLHQSGEIKLGDYPSIAESPAIQAIGQDQLKIWQKWGAQVLTFEKDDQILGCLLMMRGKNGNIFFEPFPFEPEQKSLVKDEVYTQYALLKFFEMPEARKCHLMKFGSKLVFEDKSDLDFFQDQGFQAKTVINTFNSRLEGLDRPL